MENINCLNEDPPIINQRWICISFLTTTNGVEKKIKAFKIRGTYEKYDDALKRADYLRNIDKHFDIFIGEVGKWLPCNSDVENAEEQQYAEKELNDLMSNYKDNLKTNADNEAERKKDLLKNAKIEKDNLEQINELRKKLDLKKQELNAKKISEIQEMPESSEQNDQNIDIEEKLMKIKELYDKSQE